MSSGFGGEVVGLDVLGCVRIGEVSLVVRCIVLDALATCLSFEDVEMGGACEIYCLQGVNSSQDRCRSPEQHPSNSGMGFRAKVSPCPSCQYDRSASKHPVYHFACAQVDVIWIHELI